ncbi:MAG TPA: type 4a pilus biogenesis protein PilO [Tepidisphaeraceae bacterium]|jgi:Tfp pilus assembly protein PilO
MKSYFRQIACVVVLLSLLGSSYFFGFKRMNERRDALESETAVMQQQLTTLADATAGIDDMAAQLTRLSKAVKNFEKQLPAEQEVDDILARVDELRAKHNLVSRSFRPNPKPIAGPTYREKQIDMALAGDFSGFYAFLRDLETLPRLIKVTELKLKKIDEPNGHTEASMKISIFYDPATRGFADLR